MMTSASSAVRAKRIATFSFTIAVLGLWVVLSTIYPPYLVPRPVAVLNNMLMFVSDWSFARHTVATLGHIAASMAAAFVLGGLLATLAHFVPVFRLAIHHLLSPFSNSFSCVDRSILDVDCLGICLPTVMVAQTDIQLP